MHPARITGILYLLIIACGIFAEAAVRASLVVAGDPAATAANLRASETLFRAAFAADAIMLICDVAVAVLLYLLFRPVDRTLSLLAAAFRFAQASVLGVNLLNLYTPLLLLTGGAYTGGLAESQRETLALFFLDLHGHGYDLGLIFFGVSNLLLGYLAVRSERVPSLLGYALAAAALVYLAGSSIRFLLPDLTGAFQPLYFIPLIAELAFALWLVTRGNRMARIGPG